MWQLSRTKYIRMTRKNLFNKARSRSRHPDDENRFF